MNTSGAMYLCACCVCFGFRLYGLGVWVKGLAAVVLGPHQYLWCHGSVLFRVYVSVCVVCVFDLGFMV
jgi:hypothetical protein